MHRFIHSNIVQLVFFIIAGGIVSMLLRYELLWDFANYHYYNPWAFLNNRLGYDIMPAGINTFFNPLMDIPLYLLIKYFNDYPQVIYFIMGIPFGALSFVFFKIAQLFFDRFSAQGKLSIITCIAIAVTGFGVFMQIGTSTNEIPNALLVMLSFYLILKYAVLEKSNNVWLFLGCGFLLGCAAGLKPTALIYCVSAGLTLIICHHQIINFKRNLGWFILGGILGYLLCNGFWMYILWNKFQNPFMPFANNFFQSDYMPYSNFRDYKYLPGVWWQYLIYPLWTASKLYSLNDEIIVADYRFALVYLIFIGFILRYIKNRCRWSALNIDKQTMFLIVYLIVSYLLWLGTFAINRYLVTVEMLCAIILVKTFWFLMPKKEWLQTLYLSISIILLYIILSTPFYSDTWGYRRAIPEPLDNDSVINERIESGASLTIPLPMPRIQITTNELKYQTGFDKFLDVEEVKLPEDTLIMLYNLPSAALIPLLSKDTKVRAVLMKQQVVKIAVEQKTIDIMELPKWNQLKKMAIDNHKGPKIAIITYHPNHPELMINIQQEKELKNMYCRGLYNNLYPYWKICVPKGMEKLILPEKHEYE